MKVTGREVTLTIIGSDGMMCENGQLWIHLSRVGLEDSRYEAIESFCVDVDISEWADDDSPDRYYEEFETLKNEEFMQACEDLADQINSYIERNSIEVTVNIPTGNMFEDGTPEIGWTFTRKVFNVKDFDEFLDEVDSTGFYLEVEGEEVSVCDVVRMLTD